ncbi:MULTISPECIES: AdeC/AdeK/OprM family multidrug efflux complex outer membrane factor [Cupriavidus]|uniref:RND efflux system, outer membrane lipoprotein, NodT n=2 Tax=Cupriavidus pinatubonensis TaxID=248026 RepID=Q46TU0_CUPPJ|nr:MULTISPECIES: AdeC/AdeK/OprM family multidrug efflux complex outer membrane factor [Cupriavidus]QYY28817.1 AdeC/AdeK/OprM family multidrug efflux complex outer membrane factor [Cupriavidus pinatubonensis]
MKKTLTCAAAVALLAGCSLIPSYEQPSLPVAQAYPQGAAYPTADAAAGAQQMRATDLGWRDFFADARLRRLIEVALDNNRDLRVAALNVEAFRAQYQIERADLFPAIGVAAQETRQRIPADLSTTGRRIIASQYGVSLGTTAWELDLFGRIRSLSEAALEQYFASDETRRSAQIALVASVANAYLALLADDAQLTLTRSTLANYERSYGLTRRSYEEGIASRLDLRQSQTAVENARASLARYTRLVAQDENALVLLLGTGMPDDLPAPLPLDQKLTADVPAGLPSDLLQNRPDVLAAEHRLRSANANIGAARAAFFPRIALTASAGTASNELSGLFKAGSGTWLFQPQISLPLFTAGSLRASLDYAKIQKDINVAQYERTIQTAFREVSDGLAARGTYTSQLEAQVRFVEAAQDAYNLADRRYRTGVDSYLAVLDAQRSLYNAQQLLIVARQEQLTSEVNLYKALGGGWHDQTGPAADTGGQPAPAPAS